MSVTGRWFFPATLVSSINKTDRHDITEIVLKVALNTINLKPEFTIKETIFIIVNILELYNFLINCYNKYFVVLLSLSPNLIKITSLIPPFFSDIGDIIPRDIKKEIATKYLILNQINRVGHSYRYQNDHYCMFSTYGKALV